MRGKLLIFSTRATRCYAADVVRSLRAPQGKTAEDGIEGDLSVSRFADGELEAEVGTSVRGRDVFLFSSAARNDLGLVSEECKIEMYHAVDALRRAQAGRITLFEPYCSPGRSDRLTRRNSVGLWVHFKTLVSLGIDHYITFQLHSEKSKTFIDPAVCDVDDIPAYVLLMEYLCDHVIRTPERLASVVRREWVFCSVDAGGEALAKKFATSFGTQMIISQKQRDYSTPNAIESINILSSRPIEGKTVWIVDDMIDTGNSVVKLVAELEKQKPASINVAVVHPVFSPPCLDTVGELCARGAISSILATDTVDCGRHVKGSLPCLQIVPSVKLAADIVLRLNRELPLSPLLLPFNPVNYLKRAGGT